MAKNDINELMEAAVEARDTDENERSVRAAYKDIGVTDQYVERARANLADQRRSRNIKLGAIAGVIGLSFLILVGTYNGVNGEYNDLQTAQRQVVNVVQRQEALIPALEDVVSQADSQQLEILNAYKGVVEGLSDGSQSPASFAALINTFGQVQGDVAGLTSGNTELRQDLMAEITGSVNRISVETMRFNDQLNDYNKATTGWPGGMISGWFGFKPIQLDGGVDSSVGFGTN